MKNFLATTIVSHDAGGAEILSSYVKNTKGNYIFVLSGPAKRIFKRKIKNIRILKLDKAEKISFKLICGTSFKSKIELEAINKFKKNRKETIAVIDHWINYKLRFIKNKNLILPDKIWVFDKYAKISIKKIFPKLKIYLKKNFYFLDIKKNIRQKIKKNNKSHILYVSEPINNFKKIKLNNFKDFAEYKTVKYLFDNIKYITKKNYKIIFRIHPNENYKKYEWVSDVFTNVQFSKNKSLIQDMQNSDIIIGRQTMAMVVGLILKKKVISCIPPGEKRCMLPFKKIKELRDIVKFKKIDV
jgi:hypothetical protein